MQFAEDPPRMKRLQNIRKKPKRSDNRALVLQYWHISHELEDQLSKFNMVPGKCCVTVAASKAIAQTNSNLHSMCLRAMKRSIPLIITRKKERNKNTRNR